MTPIAYAAYSNAATQIASKEKILLMLFDGAVQFVDFARMDMLEGNIAGKGEKISKVITILTELDCALDRNVGGEVARNLTALYQYMIMRLLHANVNNDAKVLEEVEGLLSELKEGFEGAAQQLASTESMRLKSSQSAAAEKGICLAV